MTARALLPWLLVLFAACTATPGSVESIAQALTTCTTDAQCQAGTWCQEALTTCAPRLANGSALPVDPPHVSPTLNGTCTAAAAALVCVSGVCDPADNRCGYANGDGPCSAATGSVVCRSGACSVNGLCDPAGGCLVDADCSGGSWCAEATHVCTARLANGGALPVDPPHTGPTLNGLCTSQAAALVCASGVCDVHDNRCGYANADGPCTAATGAVVCRSGTCSVNGSCAPAGGCLVDADCSGGSWCTESTRVCTAPLVNGSALPVDPPHVGPTLDGTCTASAAALVCVSGVCDGLDNRCGYANGEGPCSAATGSVVCRSGACSVNGLCAPAGGCLVDADCASGSWCNEQARACTPALANGAALPVDPPHVSPPLTGVCTPMAATLTCASGVCDVVDNACGYGTGSGPCSPASAGTVCRSGACSANGTCRPTAGCNVDADCAGGTWCNEALHACTAKLANGTVLPSDAAHTNPTLDGVCTSAAAALVCASGVCDPGDSQCGYAAGTGPCTSVTGATVCRSATCSVNGACEPMGGCNVDADCAAGTWCLEAMHQCAMKVANGQPLPADPAHQAPTLSGACTAAAAALVCVSGVCSHTDNACGLAVADAPCTATTAAVVCRSASCSVSGACAPAGGCLVDGDCSGSMSSCGPSRTCVAPDAGSVLDGGGAGDAGSDAGSVAASDAGTDAGSDAGTDAGVDGGADAGSATDGGTTPGTNGNGCGCGATDANVLVIALVVLGRRRARA